MTKTYIIAEAGVNHNGSESLALDMIYQAKELGVDAVKFQLFKSESLVTQTAEQAQYQKKGSEQPKTQFQMLKELELSHSSFQKMHLTAKEMGIDFMITPFDMGSLNFITTILNLSVIKIGSGDITNGPLLLASARSKKKIILSTGMCTLSDIEYALKVLSFGYLSEKGNPTQALLDSYYYTPDAMRILQTNVTLLHCTSEYPAPVNEVNLRAIDTVQSAFGIPVGLSDHTQGIEIALAAVARGAVMIEKHFTLDKKMPGPDHMASLDPIELKAMVMGIRSIEKALGDGIKRPSVSEFKNAAVVRRSLVANKNISQGEVFTEDNIAVKRPFTGMSPMNYWNYLGKIADKDYSKDEMIL